MLQLLVVEKSSAKLSSYAPIIKDNPQTRIQVTTNQYQNYHSYLIKLLYFHFLFYLGFLSRTFTNHRTAGEGEGISLTPHYHLHPLHRHLDISLAITAENSPLHIERRRTRTWNLQFPSASHKPLSYAP